MGMDGGGSKRGMALGAATGAMEMWSAGLGALAGGWVTSWPEHSEHPQMLARIPPVIPQNAPFRVFIARPLLGPRFAATIFVRSTRILISTRAAWPKPAQESPHY